MIFDFPSKSTKFNGEYEEDYLHVILFLLVFAVDILTSVKDVRISIFEESLMLGYIRNICHRLYSTVHISCCSILFCYCSLILFFIPSLSPSFLLILLMFFFLLVTIMLFLPPIILFVNFSIFYPFILS